MPYVRHPEPRQTASPFAEIPITVIKSLRKTTSKGKESHLDRWPAGSGGFRPNTKQRQHSARAGRGKLLLQQPEAGSGQGGAWEEDTPSKATPPVVHFLIAHSARRWLVSEFLLACFHHLSLHTGNKPSTQESFWWPAHI